MGAEIDSDTKQLAKDYLCSLERGHVRTKFVTTWDEARRTARDMDWDRALLSSQITERRNLQRLANTKYKQADCRAHLEESMEAISAAADMALKTAQSTHLNDISIAKAAVGAFSESAFEVSLATLAERELQHPARLRFALFQAGRWPLTVTKELFFLF